MKRKSTNTAPIVNRRARFDYELGETIVAGLVLNGPEVRGARLGHVQLSGSYALPRDDQLWLVNMSISIPQTAQAAVGEKELSHNRKLLVTKKQYEQILAAKKQGMTIIPTKLLNKGKFIKLELSFAKGKKKWDKRETIKRRQQDRDSKRAIGAKF